MHFAHDTEVVLLSAAALVNSAGGDDDADELDSVAALDDFVREWGFTGSRTHDEAELAAVRQLRPRLRGIWTSDEETMVERVNELLREHQALPQLVRHDSFSWHIHAVSSEEPLAARMAVETAMALVDVIRLEETERLRSCDAPDCDDVLVDLSRNRSRRYCGSGCGNRMAAQAYRARQAGDATLRS